MKSIIKHIGIFAVSGFRTAAVSALSLAAVSALVFSFSCSRDASGDGAIYSDSDYGTLLLSSETSPVTSTTTNTVTRAEVGDDYMITFERHTAGAKTPVPGPMRFADCAVGGIPLVIGTYSVTVTSPEEELPGWDKPTYKGVSERFAIRHDEATSVGVVCYQSNLKTTVRFGDGLWSVLDRDNVSVRVTVDGQSLDFNNGDLRAGYFAVPAEGCAMTVSFAGTIPDESWSGTITETIEKVKPGEWQRIRFSLPDDAEFPIIVVERSHAGQIDYGDPWQ
jgi:hypothetical protein